MLDIVRIGASQASNKDTIVGWKVKTWTHNLKMLMLWLINHLSKSLS